MSNVRPVVALALLSLGACTPPEASTTLMPSLSQVRYGHVDVEALDTDYVLPEDLFIPGVVENTEEQSGYERMAIALTPDQMQKLARFDDSPAPLEKHASFTYDFAGGDLYDATDRRLDFDDVEQGAIGDCYMVAALSSVLYADADGRFREGIIRPVRDAEGDALHYAVRFYDYAGRPQDVEVDATLVRSGTGNPTYARSMDSRRDDEEWGVSLIEKAYAKWHGDYETIGDGGSPGDVMQALTGSHSTYRSIKHLTDDSMFRMVEQGATDNRPMVAITFGEDDGVDYTGTGVYAWHAYTLMGAGHRETGERYVELRNPWGSSEPPGNGPDDGIFKLDLKDFRRLYQGLNFGGGLTADTVAPAAITDLSQVGTVDGAALMQFTATGDDGQRGLAYRYDLRLSTEPITTENFYTATRIGIADPQAPGSREQIQLTDLDQGVSYFVAIRVEDESGNVSPISNVAVATATVEEETDLLVHYLFDFESDHSDHMVWDGLFHVSSEYPVAGGNALWCADAATGDYDHGHVTCDLLVVDLDLSGMTEPALRWAERFYGEVSLDLDRFFVEVQGENENEWTTVWTKADTNQFGVATQSETSLEAWAGQNISVLFRFDSVDDASNAYPGWAVDDIAIVSRATE